jgi:cyclomaltodextrinase
MTVPNWVQDAIFYQIFPDRFADGDTANNPPNVRPWNSLPTNYSFHGGDLRGVIQRFDYLLDLGINAIYFTPIFQASSNHRYNATDYLKIDPQLGDLKDFHDLVDVAHKNNVRIILDGVFNHCGRGFFAFSDILENQENSPYKDWFHIKHFPVNAYSRDGSSDYLCWWNIKSLPKFNTTNLAVRRYLLEVSHYWIEQGADGWRLDVPNEIDDDNFWAEFRHTVRKANPDAYILGEIWDGNPRWVSENHFDGLMNYPLRDALLGLVGNRITAGQFIERVEAVFKMYAKDNSYAMYQLLGSHDTERILTLLGNDWRKLQLAYLFLFAVPGAPAIYYGDEIGMEGGKDPDCRRTFSWDEKAWRSDFRSWVQKIIATRKRLAVLRQGDFQRVWMEDGKGTVAFSRSLGEEKILVVLNASNNPVKVRIPADGTGWQVGASIQNVLDGSIYGIREDGLHLNLPAWNGAWLGNAS